MKTIEEIRHDWLSRLIEKHGTVAALNEALGRARILKKSGLSEAETQRILETTVEPNVPAILAGLKGAGMR